jgi:glycosyltransferase involved in cell wall biosynthesis
LNVLFLCGWYPSKVSPTNGDFIQRHAEAVSLIHNVTIIHIISDKKSKKNIDIISEVINGIETHIAYIKHFKNPFKKIFYFIKAFNFLIKKVGFVDIVHLNELFPLGIFSLYLKWFKKIPFIISEHFTGFLITSNYKFSVIKKTISKLIVRNANAVCSVSNYLSENMQNLGLKGNYITVPNVVDTVLFNPKKKENKILKLLHVSSLKDDHKNITGMLRVAKLLDIQLDYFEWNFIGNKGNEYQSYLNNLDIKNGKISFTEHLTQEELATNLQEASICISFSNYETFGIVIPEAIACGTPVIATNTGVAIELKKEPFCKVIPIKDENALLQEILNYRNTFANIDINSMHTYVKQQFSKEVISNKFSFLYNKSLKK